MQHFFIFHSEINFHWGKLHRQLKHLENEIEYFFFIVIFFIFHSEINFKAAQTAKTSGKWNRVYFFYSKIQQGTLQMYMVINLHVNCWLLTVGVDLSFSYYCLFWGNQMIFAMGVYLYCKRTTISVYCDIWNQMIFAMGVYLYCKWTTISVYCDIWNQMIFAMGVYLYCKWTTISVYCDIWNQMIFAMGVYLYCKQTTISVYCDINNRNCAFVCCESYPFYRNSDNFCATDITNTV